MQLGISTPRINDDDHDPLAEDILGTGIDFALGWVPWKFDYSGQTTRLEGIPSTLEEYSAITKREVFRHFANRTLPATLALAASKTGTLAYLQFEALGIPRVKTEKSVRLWVRLKYPKEPV
jgi:hypothetical protein